VISYVDKFAERWKTIRYLLAGAICIAICTCGVALLFYAAFEDGLPTTMNAILVLITGIFSLLLVSLSLFAWCLTLTRIRQVHVEGGNLSLQFSIGPWIGMRRKVRLIGKFALLDLASSEGAFACRIYRSGLLIFTVSDSFNNFGEVCRLVERQETPGSN